jgi:hypothetical protein
LCPAYILIQTHNKPINAHLNSFINLLSDVSQFPLHG